MNTKLKYFIYGLILLIVAVSCVTIIPVAIKKYTPLDYSEYFLLQVESLLLIASAILYAFSSEYYQYQIFSIMCAILFYIMFVRYFSLIS